MKFVAILLSVFLLASADQSTETPRLQTSLVISRGKIQQVLKTPLPGPQMYGGGLLDAEHFRVGALRRSAPGQVEIHRDDTDIFYILAGDATIITGGKAIDAKQSSTTETIARAIENGVAHEVHAGDMMFIPKQQPHWFQKVSGDIEYVVIKVQ